MSYFKSDNAVRGIFGEKAYRKLVQLLDPCCGTSSTVPYKVYTTLLTQQDANPPVGTELENTLGVTVTYEYLSPGEYLAIFDKPIFNSPNEYVVINGQFQSSTLSADPVFFNVLYITSWDISGNTDDDNLIGLYAPCVLEIRKYN